MYDKAHRRAGLRAGPSGRERRALPPRRGRPAPRPAASPRPSPVPQPCLCPAPHRGDAVARAAWVH